MYKTIEWTDTRLEITLSLQDYCCCKHHHHSQQKFGVATCRGVFGALIAVHHCRPSTVPSSADRSPLRLALLPHPVDDVCHQLFFLHPLLLPVGRFALNTKNKNFWVSYPPLSFSWVAPWSPPPPPWCWYWAPRAAPCSPNGALICAPCNPFDSWRRRCNACIWTAGRDLRDCSHATYTCVYTSAFAKRELHHRVYKLHFRRVESGTPRVRSFSSRSCRRFRVLIPWGCTLRRLGSGLRLKFRWSSPGCPRARWIRSACYVRLPLKLLQFLVLWEGRFPRLWTKGD